GAGLVPARTPARRAGTVGAGLVPARTRARRAGTRPAPTSRARPAPTSRARPAPTPRARPAPTSRPTVAGRRWPPLLHSGLPLRMGPNASARCALLVVLLAGAVPARAQELPAGPISALDGRLAVAGEVVATAGRADTTAFFNYTDYE